MFPRELQQAFCSDTLNLLTNAAHISVSQQVYELLGVLRAEANGRKLHQSRLLADVLEW